MSLADGGNSALISIGRPDSSEREVVEISADALPRLLSRATSIVEHDEIVEAAENSYDCYLDNFNLKNNEISNVDINSSGIPTKRKLVREASKRSVCLPHFPRNVGELDYCNHLLIKYEPELDSRHPGYHDLEYRKRRKQVAQAAFNYKYGDPTPVIEYSEVENETWRYCYRQLKIAYAKYACKQHNDGLKALEEAGIYSEQKIPQLGQVSAFLSSHTGWQLRPTAGLLTARDFLASLAFRVFQTTQYIRHHGNPKHSVEPDCVHELMGHVPMLLDASFARFSQELGLASLGASDAKIEKFATLYFFTVEFGLCRDDTVETGENGSRKSSLSSTTENFPPKSLLNKQNSTTETTFSGPDVGLKCYGAALLSSFGEMEYALESHIPTLKDFVAEETAVQTIDDSEYQATYFVANSFEEAKAKLKEYATRHLKRPFEIYYDPYTNTVSVIDSPKHLQSIINEIEEQTAKLSIATKRLIANRNLILSN